MLRGPKALLSSAIAEALGEFFVVGLDQIESNLLVNTKIVLKDARLKPQFASIPKNTFGNSTEFHITGFVREVSLTWSWDFWSTDTRSWVKDVVLKFQGCRFKVRLSKGDASSKKNDGADENAEENASSDNSIDTNETDQQESLPEVQSKVDEEEPEKISMEDRVKAILDEQIQLVLNSVALTMEDFEVILEMPSPKIVPTIPGVSVFEDPEDDAGNIEMTVELQDTPTTADTSTHTPGITVFEDPEEGENIEVVESFETEKSIETENSTIATDDYTISVKVGGEELNVLSFGRYSDETLKERISLSSLFINVTETFSYTAANDSFQPRRVDCKTYPLLETFSYTLGLTRTHGERFSDIERGLMVKGGLDETIAATKKDFGGLSFHLSRPQMEAIGQLSGLLLAPQEESAKKKSPKTNDDAAAFGNVSVLDISLGSVNADVMGNELSLTDFNLRSFMDGSELMIEVESARYEEALSETKRLGTSIQCSNIVASILPSIDVTVGSVSKLYVPDVVELRTPIENVQVRLVGATWTVDIDVFDGYLPSPEVELEEHNQNDHDKQALPFAVACKVKRIFLVKDEDEEETEVAFVDVEILLYPKTDESGTELACTVGSMQSKLASATNINTCMVLPETEGETNTIRDFALSLDHLSVTAGYTIQDWKKTFRFGGKWRRNRTNSNSMKDETTSFKLPFASVAPLKTRIAYNALRVVSLKETTFLVKAYKGNKGTTAKDLLDFYTAQCLSRTPDFLQNAELLGINVKSAGAFGLGAHFLVTPIGPFVGVAAVVGVDAVRGSIEAGKRSRRAKEGEAARVGDFFRGIGYSAVEATRRGKLRRGVADSSRKGNLLDWAVGATVNTGDYIGQNKDTLGSAGGAGAGVIVGTILGGPVGAVIGGVVGGMTTGTAIRRIDKRIQKVIRTKEETKLKPGQLALSPASQS